jgi:hypothetical protein
MEIKENTFVTDLRQVQQLLSLADADVQKLYHLVEKEGKVLSEPWDGESLSADRLMTIVKQLGLKPDKESRLAFLSRLINLRQEALDQSWKKEGHSEETIENFQEVAYQIVRDYHLGRHHKVIQGIHDRDLLTAFYQTVLKGWDRIGRVISQWQIDWTRQILFQTNKELSAQFDGDTVAVNHYLDEKNLKDLGHWGKVADRCYSVLKKNALGHWESQTYSQAFPEHVENVCQEIQALVQDLEPLEDEIYHEKDAWIAYLLSLSDAFREKNPHECVARWADVDRAWMKITGMIQPGHPLEYYEDHYRKAVALEWDMRISNPEHHTEGIRKRKIRQFASEFFYEVGLNEVDSYSSIVEFCLKKLDSVQLHIGSMALYYGAGFMGLPSAQVVPNDEVVSKEKGKKIFAFPDNVIQSKKNRPFLRFSREILGQDFLTRQRKILFQNEDLWFHIYDISTIGHEYGHVLWVDQDTEALMDAHNGNFKNVEEWKATTGGLMTFFREEESSWDLKVAVIEEMIARSVGLFAWRETSEVLPYYIEGHIHLAGLFETQILNWEVGKNLKVELTPSRFKALAQWYHQTYLTLVQDFYLPKKDPSPFLSRYVSRDKKFFNAVHPQIHAFQNYFWEIYHRYGQEMDTHDTPENYKL